jgi:transcriptional regulator of acetoin/glycerol metabolism
MASHPASALIPRVGDEQIVSSLWERFVQDGAVPSDRVRNVILESWHRCRTEAVDPARASAPAAGTGGNIVALRARNRDLYEAARPVLDSLRDVLRESGTLIMLTDPLGTILDLHGESRARNAGERINLSAGGCWVEDAIGTNAIGTALAMRQPVQIYGSEHYCVDVKGWTCAAAPIFDSFGKTLLGVVDVSGVKETFHGHTVGLVIAAAKQIESALVGRDQEVQARLIEQSIDAFVRYANDCVILFDQRGRMVRSNGRMQAARDMHGIRLPLETGAQTAALNLALPENERKLQAPLWLQSDWLQAVRYRDLVLGTLLVIPLAPTRPKFAMAAGADRTASQPGPFADLIGSSPAIAAMKAKALRLASLDLPVLLLGETGVGKEVVAHCVHKSGAKAAAPFVAVNCGALTRELLASELFGYAEGAFTGARRGGHPGKFEQADGGTLFLDEIGEMPLDMQPHLLRVLQDGIVVRLGDTREKKVAVRVIAATNRDLQAEVAAGRFREDLYHRLCVTSLHLPALRDRPEDILEIVDRLNEQFALKYACAPKAIEAEVIGVFLRYPWPGNVREMKNIFEAMFALCDGDTIVLSQLPVEMTRAQHAGLQPTVANTALPGRLQDMERQVVMATIANARGNMSQAAKSLGISRSTLYVKLAAMQNPPAAEQRTC